MYKRNFARILVTAAASCAIVPIAGCVLPGHWGKNKDSLAEAKAFVESRQSLAAIDAQPHLPSQADSTSRTDSFSQTDSRSQAPSISQTAFVDEMNTIQQLPDVPSGVERKQLQPLASESELIEDAMPLSPKRQSESGSVVLPTLQLSSLAPRDSSQAIDHLRDLSDQEMVSLAFANSPVMRPLGIRVIDQPGSVTTVFDRAITASDPFYGPQAALAQFDSQLSAGLDSQNNDRVFNNSTLGGNVQELTQDFGNLNLGWQKRMLGGGTVGIQGITTYDSNNRQANIFPSYWERQIEATIRQPLARGAGRQYNLIAGPNAQPGFNFSNGIVIARLNTRITDSDFEIAVRRFIRDLYATYWQLAEKFQNYESINAAADIAYRTWQQTLAKREANLEGGEANREAEARAKFYRYRHELQLALGGTNGLYVTERQLRQQMGLNIVDGELLHPSTPAAIAPVHYDFESLVADGFVHRTELRRQSLRVQQQELRLVAAKNFLLPQMDVISRYRLRGFGDDLFGDGTRFASANQDLFSLDHQEWQFGLEMGITAGRRQAHAAVQSAMLQLQRERAILNEQQREIQHEVSDAYAAVSSSFAALETSQAQMDAAEQRLAASEAMFESDKLQIEFLLDAQAELLQARQARIADQTSYTLALVQVADATGRLLHETGVSTLCACHD